jgi:hypothetical protein
VGNIKIFDLAEQFRIEIEGRFSGEIVPKVAECWHKALSELNPRRVIIDISQLSGYDPEGSRLLRQMYRHGTHLSARNARALAFLDEISTYKLPGPTLVYKSEHEPKRKSDAKTAAKPLVWAAGAGK